MSAARSEHEVSEIIDGLSEQEVSLRPDWRPGRWASRACDCSVGPPGESPLPVPGPEGPEDGQTGVPGALEEGPPGSTCSITTPHQGASGGISPLSS